MTWSVTNIPELTGKNVIVTGANSGIGFEACRVFARKGARIVLACRNADKAQQAARRITAETPNAVLEVASLDLASLASVREFAARVREQYQNIHLLVNNAGVMAIPRVLTADGFETQLGVNHFGHFALTGLLLDRLWATEGARVVTVSSFMHQLGKIAFDDLDGARRYQRSTAYCQSKLANVLFTFELAHRLEAKKAPVLSVACHPGYADTNLQMVGPEMAGSRLRLEIMKVSNRYLARPAQEGAWPTLYASTAADVKNGDFIGPTVFFQLFGPPGNVKANRRAYDRELMYRLWNVSIERTGVDYSALR
jgi:NAD(P)-dependent dehydrogenase (short-subunit alcohol dehydrogenase family)